MSRPPLKAIEQIQRWCEKHWCDKCPFAYVIKDNHGIMSHECFLNDLPPWQWVQCNFQERKDHKPFEKVRIESKMDEVTEDELVNTAYKYEDATNISTDEVTE